jgi:rubrerythrin
MTFEDMWKSLEEKDTTGKYKQAREMADLNMEQLEFAYNSGYADAKSKYERSKGEWAEPLWTNWNEIQAGLLICPFCGATPHKQYKNFCPNCGADMRGAE